MVKGLETRKILMLLDNNFVSDTRVEKEIRALIQAGATISVACISDPKLPETEVRNGYTILRRIKDGYNAPLRKTYRSFIEQTSGELLELDFDTLHCHDFYMLSIGVEMKRKRPEIKLVYDAHEYVAGWPFYKNSSGLNKWKGLLVWRKLVQKEKQEIREADQVITITDAIADRFAANTKTRPLVIGNYSENVEIDSDPQYFRNLYGLGQNTKILVHSGTIYQNDRLLTRVFDFLATQNEFVLVLVGNRPRFDHIKHWVAQNDHWKSHIFFHDYPKDQQETIRLLSHADAGWLYVNDQWEAHRIGFSNRFVEYLAAGLPVIASPQEFTRNVHQKYTCCTFYAADHFGEFCQALNKLNVDFSAHKNGAMYARQSLNWEDEANKLITYYIR